MWDRVGVYGRGAKRDQGADTFVCVSLVLVLVFVCPNEPSGNQKIGPMDEKLATTRRVVEGSLPHIRENG